MSRKTAPIGIGAALAIVCAILPYACREGAPRPAPTDDLARARVVRFWTEFDAATRRRAVRDLSGAIDHYRRALAFDPRHEDSLYYLGQCLRELGRTAEARKAFEELLAVDPHSGRGHQSLGGLLASPDAADSLDLAGAEQHFRRAHEINSEETGPMVRLAEILIVTGRLVEARRWLESAARTNARSVEAPFLIGYLAWEAGDAAAARSYAVRARTAARPDAPGRGVLGEGDRKAAGGRMAPPLASPLGRTLFGEAASFLPAASAADHSPSYDEFTAAWRRVAASRRAYAGRAAASR